MKNQLSQLLSVAALVLVAVNPCAAQAISSSSAQTGTAPFSPSWDSDPAFSISDGDFLSGTTGVFTGVGGYDNETSATLAVVTDGSAGPYDSSKANLIAPDSGTTLTFALTSAAQLTSIDVYGGWADGGRAHNQFSVSYSTDGLTYTPLILNVNYDGASTSVGGSPVAIRSTITDSAGFLAGGAAIKDLAFTFNGGTYFGYSEFAAYGSAVVETPEPSTYALLGMGVLALAIGVRRKRNLV